MFIHNLRTTFIQTVVNEMVKLRLKALNTGVIFKKKLNTNLPHVKNVVTTIGRREITL